MRKILSTDEYLGWLHSLPTINIDEQYLFGKKKQVILIYDPDSVIYGSCYFMMNCHTHYYSGYIILHPY